MIPYRGDRYLLCSDGLFNEVDDDQIAAVLRRLADPTEAAARAGAPGQRGRRSRQHHRGRRRRRRRRRPGRRPSAALADDSTRPVPITPVVDRRSDRDDDADSYADRRARCCRAADDDALPTSDDRLAQRLRRHGPRRGRSIDLAGRRCSCCCCSSSSGGRGRRHRLVRPRGPTSSASETASVAIYQGRPGGLLWFDPTRRAAHRHRARRSCRRRCRDVDRQGQGPEFTLDAGRALRREPAGPDRPRHRRRRRPSTTHDHDHDGDRARPSRPRAPVAPPAVAPPTRDRRARGGHDRGRSIGTCGATPSSA